MYIDSRYPPQPKQMEVPLYPSRLLSLGSITPDSEQQLSEALESMFECDTDQLVVGESASSLLRAHLSVRARESHQSRVALPIFSCQSLVDAVIDSGSLPIFYDIDNDGSISSRGVDYAIQQNSNTYIWPSFFGSRDRDAKLINRLHDAGISIVFDEAQANPFDSNAANVREAISGKDIILYSYGASKLLAASGGGSLYAAPGSSSVELINEAVASETQQAIRPSSYSESVSGQLFETQDALLESRQHVGSTSIAIGATDAEFTLRQIASYLKLSDRHNERYVRTRGTIDEVLGPQALDYLAGVSDTPSILAIKVAPRERYAFMADLAEQGIQTTWYYYPINRISRYRDYPAQEDIGSIAIASSVVILPFQWTHSNAQVNRLNDVLSVLGDGYGSRT